MVNNTDNRAVTAKTIMVQGTTSDAGKSTVVAGICRLLANRGFKVAPFKPQNMALNSAVTPDGKEIGRAQAVQAIAAKVPLDVDFNPILLKPSSDKRAQVIVHGEPITDLDAVDYHDYKKVAMQAVMESYQRLQQDYDFIVVEGAGSPAEINLREGDIANMGFAEKADIPVVLVADIDRGGVFAQLVGTLALLADSEQQRTLGFVINKFRGDLSLLQPGIDWLEQRTGKPVFGTLPYLQGLDVAAEDAITTQQNLQQDKIRVVVPVLSRISNHTDFDPLRLHPDVDLVYAAPGKPLPAADLIILPGTKNTCADLQFVYQQGWDKDIARHLRYGGKLMGICGGYQMLGQEISDPESIESASTTVQGLGYLPIRSTFYKQKMLTNRSATLRLNKQSVDVVGYEIHQGQSEFIGTQQPILQSDDWHDGIVSNDHQVLGCYLHGIFAKPKAVQLILSWAGSAVSEAEDYQVQQQQALERLATAVEQHIEIEQLINHTENWGNYD